jgi:S1-C subfamily serine protease
MSGRLLTLAAAAATTLTSAAGHAHVPPAVGGSVVRLTIDTGLLRPELAAGWVGPCGFVVTVAHALDRARAITVTDAPGRSAEATIAAIDHRPDLALLEAPALRLTALGVDPPRSGQAWVVLPRPGRPELAAMGVEPVGVNISDYSGEHRRAGLQLDRPLVPGDSGAPVVGARGRVVGVVFAASERRAYATSAVEVTALVDRTRPGCDRVP